MVMAPRKKNVFFSLYRNFGIRIKMVVVAVINWKKILKLKVIKTSFTLE